jgi:shikimate kinase
MCQDTGKSMTSSNPPEDAPPLPPPHVPGVFGDSGSGPPESRDNVLRNGEPCAAIPLPIVLIGPVNAGKSTIGELLAARLGVGRATLDELCWGYFEEDAGYDPAMAREQFERGGQAGALEYMVQFYSAAVERVLAEHPESVIDLGAGHTVHDNPHLLARTRQVMAPHPNVVLLLPSPDPDESLRILHERQSNPHPEAVTMNEQFVRNPSNRQLAKIIIYTNDNSPEETCQEIVDRLVLR